MSNWIPETQTIVMTIVTFLICGGVAAFLIIKLIKLYRRLDGPTLHIVSSSNISQAERAQILERLVSSEDLHLETVKLPDKTIVNVDPLLKEIREKHNHEPH